MADRSKLGNPNYTSGRVEHWRLKKGSNVYRIGPPYGEYAATGRWFRYIMQHFGYRSKGTDQKPDGFPRPFLCTLQVDRRTDMVKVPCAECAEIEANNTSLESTELELQKQGKTEAEMDAILSERRKWKKEHNIDKKYVMAAKNAEGKWGFLWIPYKAKQALDAAIKKAQADGLNPVGVDNGVWFDFEMDDSQGWNKIHYGCDVVMDTVKGEDGRRYKAVKVDNLSDADVETIENLPQLGSLGNALTVDQIQTLVESAGDPEIVDQVFGEGRQVREASPKPVAKVGPPQVAVKANPTTVTIKAPPPSVTVAPAETLKPEVSAQDDEAAIEARLEAQLAALRAKKAAPTPPPPKPVAKPAVNPDDMDDATFVATYGKKL